MLTLTHEQFFDEKARDDHGRGWSMALDRLEKLSHDPRLYRSRSPERRRPPGAAVRRPAARSGRPRRVVQGLLMHEHIAPAYGLTPQPRAARPGACPAGREDRSQAIVAHDARPLPRRAPPGERQVGVCRHFTLLHVAMLRRARRAGARPLRLRRLLREGQVRRPLGDRVLERRPQGAGCWSMPSSTPASASSSGSPSIRSTCRAISSWWRATPGSCCRAGKADPKAFGILDMHGLWFIAGNVIRDVAALNNHEMLPWDVWGAMAQKRRRDRPRLHRPAGRADRRARPPFRRAARGLPGPARRPCRATVFNAVRNRPETL